MSAFDTMSFFRLTMPRVTPTDAMPGIRASEEDFLALCAALYEALDTFQETHPDITYGDCYHAAANLMRDIVSDYAEATADA